MRRPRRLLLVLISGAVVASGFAVTPAAAAPTVPTTAASPTTGSSTAGSTSAEPTTAESTSDAEPSASADATTTAPPAVDPVKPLVPGAAPDDQPPAGADDGAPVGTIKPHVAVTQAQQVQPTAVTPDKTHRYFGDGPWNAIATAAANQTKCSGLTSAELQAMVLTTIFRESAGATSAGSEPAPMTLSRYDEWTGVRANNTNINANYGLYAFRDPNTSYKRVFWHPGIGIWQYDSAGIGAPYTAAERISTSFLAPKVAADMASAYCSSTQTTEEGKRYDAWYPWYLSCDTDPEWTGGQINPNAIYCEQIYQGLMQTNFTIVTRTTGFSATGGTVQHTCVLINVGSYPCTLVDPTKAQGATWWATMKPLDGGAPNRDTSPATPISTPFYVIKRNGLEQRYWLSVDSGYARDVTGTRILGKNARPKDNQSGSGVTWSYGNGLCDLTINRGACGPGNPPSGVRASKVAVTSSYRVSRLDANGDGRDDLLFYAPGSAGDYLWINQGNGTFRSYGVPIGGDVQLTTADVDGDGKDDLFLYDATTGAGTLWRSRGDGTFSATSVTMPKGVRLYKVSRRTDHREELFAYGPGGIADAFWAWNGSRLVASATSVSGNYQVLVGDFDGNGRDDLFFYAPGSTQDYVWLASSTGTYVSRRSTVSGTYRPLVGDADGDGKDDIVWYAPGSATDAVWFGAAGGAFASRGLTVNASYQPVMVDLPNTGRKRVLWYAPGAADDYWGTWTAARAYSTSRVSILGTQTPIVGSFSAGGHDGLFWYGPGALPDYLWYQ